MKQTSEPQFTFEPTELLKEKVIDLARGAESSNYVAGLRLGHALGGVYVREHNRLKQKYGESHPRTQEAKLRLDIGGEARKAMRLRHTEVSTPTPDAGNGWAVDGFVRTAAGDAVPSVTVAAYDRQNEYDKRFGYACTDGKGYFSIVVERLPDQDTRVYMRASKGKTLFKSNENRLAPTAGQTDRITITLKDDGSGDCIPPFGGKGKSRPPDQAPGKEHAQPGKETQKPGAASVKPTETMANRPGSASQHVQQAKVMKETGASPTEADIKGSAGGKKEKPSSKGTR